MPTLLSERASCPVLLTAQYSVLPPFAGRLRLSLPPATTPPAISRLPLAPAIDPLAVVYFVLSVAFITDYQNRL